jgi:hypothetical protein
METITVELPEKYYWRIVQGMAAAGTASHRHGMERHAEQFHEAEKLLYQAYEQHESDDEGFEYEIGVMYRDEEMKVLSATDETLASTAREVFETYPDRWLAVRPR